MDNMTNLFNEILDEQSLIKLVFGNLRKKSNPYNKVTIRPLLLQDTLSYQAEYHFDQKVTHENLDRNDCLALSMKLLADSFKQANIFTVFADYQILANNVDRAKIIKSAPTKTQGDLNHNKAKHYLIPNGEPCDFLIYLGVMDKNNQIIPKHYAKFRQINRFLEIVSDILVELPEDTPSKPLKIIDFGCGKAYLTFALYYYLKLNLNKNVEIVGLDLKEEVIDFCNQVASSLNYTHLSFQLGDIADYDDCAQAHMVVTLHACDTATDFALIKAARWNASVILSVPCCQHELFSQIENPLQDPLLKYGILKERFSAILTDGLRALKLEENGYAVEMIEFTSLEHTAKNIMIRAVKTGKENKASGEQYKKLMDYWHVHPSIHQL